MLNSKPITKPLAIGASDSKKTTAQSPPMMANFPTSARYNVASSLVPDSARSVGRQNTRQAAYPTPIAPMPAPTKTEKLIASP